MPYTVKLPPLLGPAQATAVSPYGAGPGTAGTTGNNNPAAEHQAEPAHKRLATQRPQAAPADLIAQYRDILARLWDLDAAGADADLAEGAPLLQEHARLTDELGPAFAEAVSRQWRREDNAKRIGACRWCGAWAPSHDLDDAGHPCPLATDPGPLGV
jgi:hypothetical protein